MTCRLMGKQSIQTKYSESSADSADSVNRLLCYSSLINLLTMSSGARVHLGPSPITLVITLVVIIVNLQCSR